MAASACLLRYEGALAASPIFRTGGEDDHLALTWLLPDFGVVPNCMPRAGTSAGPGVFEVVPLSLTSSCVASESDVCSRTEETGCAAGALQHGGAFMLLGAMLIDYEGRTTHERGTA